VALTSQPAKSPEKQGIAKSGSTQSASQAEASANTDQQSKPEVAAIGNVSSVANKPHTDQSNDDVGVQRNIEIFTGLLVLVGFLQGIVMFLTWRIYGRQANEMRRQRHEMRRQRHVMYRQLKAMRAQLAQMESAGKQTDQLISQAEDQASALLAAAEAATNQAAAAHLTAQATMKNIELLINKERAILTVGVRDLGLKVVGPNAVNLNIGFTGQLRHSSWIPLWRLRLLIPRSHHREICSR
jgi:hypothetical protein